MKDKNIAGILALFLGGFGIHRFYLGQTGLGVFYLIFCWFPVMWMVGLIDAIVLFSMDKENFDVKYNKEFYKLSKRENADYDRGERKYYYDKNMRRRQEREVRKESRQQRHSPAKPAPNNEQEKASGIRRFKDYDYEGAIKDFERALKIVPNDIAVHFNLACTYSLMENTEKSLYHLDKAVSHGFNDVQKIKEHDALAYLRVQPEFETFEKNEYHLVKPLEAPPEIQAVSIGDKKSDEVLDLNGEDLLEQLQRLGDLREKGLLTEEEFVAQKRKLLG